MAIHEFVLDFALRKCGRGRLLDFGCGRGEIVVAARGLGLEAYGTDIFYGGGSYKHEVESMLGTTILEMQNGKIPFPEAYFDCVVSNQVFEHIDDFSDPLDEVARVLKSGGVFITLFPTIDVWREGHIGIPFAHWFRKGSRLRYAYTFAACCLGLGERRGTPAAHWARSALAWIDEWTYYKPLGQVIASFSRHFSVSSAETEYFRYRLAKTPLKFLAPLLLPFGGHVEAFACSRFATRVFVLQKC